MIPRPKALVLAAALAVLPGLATAATQLFSGAFYTFNFTLDPGVTSVLEFEAAEDIDIGAFAVSATGIFEDLEDVSIDFGDVTGAPFDTITQVPGLPIGFAGSVIPGFGPFLEGDEFAITFNDGINEPVAITLSFVTEGIGGVVPLPLPAGSLLLLTALGGALFWRRRPTDA